MNVRPPEHLHDYRKPEAIEFDAKTADKYAEPGTVEHFCYRLGFYPNNEESAEAIIRRIILEWHFYETWINLHECENEK